jgi:2-hydroxychromene-2-carboxylate isomerase
MAEPITFYFDFSSPYSYIASEWIEPLAARHGRALRWVPTLLGVLFKEAGLQAPVAYKNKDVYSLMDFARSAAFEGVRYAQPVKFPIATHNAARIFLWLEQTQPERAVSWAHEVFRAYFVRGEDVSDEMSLLALAHGFMLDVQRVREAVKDAGIKARLAACNDEALAQGVFGAPFFVVDGEKFWGNDRKPQLERYLAGGKFW